MRVLLKLSLVVFTTVSFTSYGENAITQSVGFRYTVVIGTSSVVATCVTSAIRNVVNAAGGSEPFSSVGITEFDQIRGNLTGDFPHLAKCKVYNERPEGSAFERTLFARHRNGLAEFESASQNSAPRKASDGFRYLGFLCVGMESIMRGYRSVPGALCERLPLRALHALIAGVAFGAGEGLVHLGKAANRCRGWVFSREFLADAQLVASGQEPQHYRAIGTMDHDASVSLPSGHSYDIASGALAVFSAFLMYRAMKGSLLTTICGGMAGTTIAMVIGLNLSFLRFDVGAHYPGDILLGNVIAWAFMGTGALINHQLGKSGWRGSRSAYAAAPISTGAWTESVEMGQ